MPTMDEVITSQSVRNLKEAADAGLLELEARGSNYLWISTKGGDEDISEALLRWTHAQLMATARRDPNPPNPEFPYRAAKQIGQLFPAKGNFRYSGLASEITYLMGINGLAWKPGNASWRLWLRHWPQGFRPQLAMSSHFKMDWQTEASIEREAKVERPVVVTRDLRLIPTPEMEPEAIKAWVTLFVPAALALQAEVEALKGQVADLEAELEAKNGSKAWGEVGNIIAATLGQDTP